MATGESVEGDTLIAKAGGNGKSRRGKLSCQKNNSPSAGKGDRADGVGVRAAVGGGGGGEVGGGGTTSKIKRPQYCTICKNHNKQVLKKRHKCPYSDCQCPLCQLSRRVQCIMCHQQRLWRFRKSMEKNGGSSSSQGGSEVSTTPNSSNASPSSSNSSTASTFASERDCQLQESLVDDPLGGSELSNGKEGLKCERPGKQQVCDKCRNHDIWVLKRGHKGKCPYENCTCQYCSFTIKRRDLMKHQQRVRRAQVTTVATTGPQDYLLQPVENSAAAKTANSPPPDEESVSSPDGNCAINDKEPHHDNPNSSTEGQVTWPNCSNDKPEDLRVSPKLPPHQPSRGSPPSQHPGGDPTSYQSSSAPSLDKHPQIDSMPLQQASIDAMPFQQSSPNTTSFQQPSRESTPFQQNKDIAIAYQQQRRDSISFNVQNTDSVSLQHSATDHMSFQQTIRDSAPFHQPSRHTSQFEHRMEDSSSFQQSNEECMPHRQQNGDSKPFQQLDGDSMPFHMPNRESTSFQPPSRDPTPYQQPIRNIATYQQTNRGMTFQQSIRESTAFHQQDRETGIAFQQPNTEYAPFQKQRRDLTSLQESSKETVIFPQPQRDTETPFQQQNRDSTPFQQSIPANHASSYTHMIPENAMESPLKRMKIEPNFENDAVYDCNGIQNHLENYQILDSNGNLTPPREYLPLSHDITSIRNYNNIPRSHLQPKFGVHPEDLLLRHWPASDMEIDNNQSQNGRNIREASVCSPLTHNPQQLNLSQNQMQIQTQPTNQQLIGDRAEADFKPHVSIVGSWGSSNVSMSTLSAPRLPMHIAQTQCSAMHLSACEEYASSPAVQSQGAWWHQVRMAGLERTNSC